MYFNYPWGGLLEELSNLEDFDTLLETREDLKIFHAKLKALDGATTLEDIENTLKTFSVLDRNYLNSPLLDQLGAIFELPVPPCCRLLSACEKLYLEATSYLLERLEWNEESYEHPLISEPARQGRLDLIKLILERKKSLDIASTISSGVHCGAVNDRFEVVNYLIDYLERNYKCKVSISHVTLDSVKGDMAELLKARTVVI